MVLIISVIIAIIVIVVYFKMSKYSAKPEICSNAKKTFHSLIIIEFSTHVNLITCTPQDIIKPGDISRNPSGALVE